MTVVDRISILFSNYYVLVLILNSNYDFTLTFFYFVFLSLLFHRKASVYPEIQSVSSSQDLANLNNNKNHRNRAKTQNYPLSLQSLP